MGTLDVCESIQNPENGRYVLFRDSFLSGWRSPLCPTDSYFALLVSGEQEARTVVAAGNRRSDFQLLIDDADFDHLTNLASKQGSHVAVRDESECSRFYQPDGFGEAAVEL